MKEDLNQNYFEELVFSSDGFSIFTIITFLVGILVIVPGFTGIIWYEKYGNHRNRTLINQMNASLSWVVLLYFTIVATSDACRYTIGAFSLNYCEALQFMRVSLWTAGFCISGVIIVLKYIFIFRLSNFAVINDGIIAVSLNLSILFIAIWTTIVKRFSVGILPLNHYICSGINPQESLGTKAYQSMAKKYNSSLIVVSLCFLLHVVLGPKILMFKRKSEKKVEPIILGNLNQQHPHGDNCLEGNKAQKSFSPLSKSIMDMTTHGLLLTFMASLGILIYKMNTIEPAILKFKPWYPYTVHLIGPTVIVSGCTILLYTRNNGLRLAVFREVQEKLRFLSNKW